MKLNGLLSDIQSKFSTTSQKKSPNVSVVHERLYNESERINAIKGHLYNPYRKEEEAFAECSFKPKLISHKSQKSLGTS